MLENIALSFRSIWNHKLRSLLTMLGIIIGIAAIITIVSTIKGTNERIKENLIGAGNNVVSVSPQVEDGYLDLEYSAPPAEIAPITEEQRQELEELDGVKEVSLTRTCSYPEGIYYRNTSFSGNLVGADAHLFSVMGYKLSYGRGFTDSDFANRRKVAILDSKAQNSLFEGENPIGKTLEIREEAFTVIGVVDKSASSSPTINSLEDYYMYADTSSGTIFIPTDCWQTIYYYDVPQTVALTADSTDDMTDAGNNAANYLTEHVCSGSYLYLADNLLEQAGELQALSAETNSQLIWIAGISLLVGGIGVMNIMLVSVTERTREIGLKKALGARKKRILLQFLMEAAVLTSLGGLLGVGCGIGLSHMLAGVMGTAVAISAPACIIAVAFSMVIGIVFGLVPAVKAAKLNPIDALRRE